MSYVIEKHIPIPPIVLRRKPQAYPFKSLSIGDSFFVAVTGEGDPKAELGRVQRLAATTGRALNWKFVTRRVIDGDEILGVRIWRHA